MPWLMLVARAAGARAFQEKPAFEGQPFFFKARSGRSGERPPIRGAAPRSSCILLNCITVLARCARPPLPRVRKSLPPFRLAALAEAIVKQLEKERRTRTAPNGSNPKHQPNLNLIIPHCKSRLDLNSNPESNPNSNRRAPRRRAAVP